MANPLNDFGLKIFLDRYAQKDTTKATLTPGDLVVVCTNQKTRQREVGNVVELLDNPGNKPRVRIKLLDGSEVTQDWDDVDKPTETTPEQTMARTARGIAGQESEEKRGEWEEKFKWLLDEWRFVPGGRILSAAGTEQALTYFNCFSRDTLVHLDTGIVEIGTLTGTRNVLSQGGVYRPAEFRSHGVQKLWRIKFSNGEIVLATAEHEWLTWSKVEGNDQLQPDEGPRTLTRDLCGSYVEIITGAGGWVQVVELEEDFTEEEVFCCNEPETHTLVIGRSGLLTGNCYVVPSPKDSRTGIVETLSSMMEIMSRGGGVGINLSSLRPRHNYVKGVNGRSSGSISWGGLYSFVTGLIEQGGCFAPYTRILTDKGHIAVCDIVDGMERGERYKAWTHKGWRAITDKFRNGPKHVYRLTTEDGYTLDITADHKVMVRYGAHMDLIPLRYVKPGDEVVILREPDGSLPDPADRSANDIPDGETHGEVQQDLPEHLHVNLEFNFDQTTCTSSAVTGVSSICVMDTFDLTVDEVHTMSGDGIYVSNSRRGALMLILNLDHPDVLDFIDAKREAGKITNANISVAIPDAFMDAVRDDGDWNLVFPDTTHEAYDAEWNGDLKAWRAKGYPVVTHKTVRARELWRKIASSAWASAEPGILFIDRVNAMSNSHYFSPLICTNPCGEQPLPAWGICNLGAINLGVHVDDNGKVKWDELKQTVRYAVRFLDNVIDATPYFIDENKKQQQNERRVGLGIMGLAEMLVKCGVRYGSKAGVEFVDELGKFIATEAYIASSDYAAEKGAFPAFDADKLLDSGFMKGMPKSVRSLVKKQGLRNVTLLTVAPTGTTGTMVDTSTGVEPYFSWTYWRKSRLGMNEIEVDIVKDWRKANPEARDLPDYFVTAMELSPEEHVVMQGALQRWIDSALSKTCNAPNNYTVDDVQKLYELMYKLGCKGGTIYRDGSRDEQVLMTKAEPVAAVAAQAPDIDAEARKLGYVKIEDAATNPDVIAKILASVGVQAQPDLVSRRRKDKVMQSINCKQQTHLGSCYTDVTYDRNNDPLEIFVRSGKAGSDVASLAEGLGRLASTLLTMPSPVPPMERLRDIAGHLEGIGGSDSVGFGRAQIKSMPDAVGKSLSIIADELDTRKGKVTAAAEPEEKVDESKPVRKSKKAAADICPSCGGATYIREEGCKHCTSCGHSACG